MGSWGSGQAFLGSSSAGRVDWCVVGCSSRPVDWEAPCESEGFKKKQALSSLNGFVDCVFLMLLGSSGCLGGKFLVYVTEIDVYS